MQLLRKSMVGNLGRTFSGVCGIALLAAFEAKAYELETVIMVDEAPESSSPVYGLELTYYFRPVVHGGGIPREELPWMERISSLTVGTNYERDTERLFEVEEWMDYRYEWDYRSKSTLQGLEVEYVYRERDTPHAFTVGGVYYQNDRELDGVYSEFFDGFLDYQESFSVEMDTTGFGVEAAYDYYLQDDWTMGASVGYVEFDTFEESFDTKAAGARTQKMWRLGGNRWAGLGASATYVRVDNIAKGWNYEIVGKFYFNERTGIFVSAAEEDFSDTRVYEAGISHYVNDFVFVRLSGSSSRLDEATFDDDRTRTGWGIAIGSRF